MNLFHKKLNGFITIASISLILGAIFTTIFFVWQLLSSAPFIINVYESVSKGKQQSYDLVKKTNCGNLGCGICTVDDCLISNLLYAPDIHFGLATLEGYYTKIEREEMGGQKVICDAFVVLDSSREIEMDSVNINLTEISPDVKDYIINSTSNNQIGLHVFWDQPLGKGRNACHSSFEIIKTFDADLSIYIEKFINILEDDPTHQSSITEISVCEYQNNKIYKWYNTYKSENGLFDKNGSLICYQGSCKNFENSTCKVIWARP